MLVHSPDTQASNLTPTIQSSRDTPNPEQIDIGIVEDLPDLIDVHKELLSDFNSWGHSVLGYHW